MTRRIVVIGAGAAGTMAAIFAADVAGYSRLMEADEEQTLATLSGHRRIVDEAILRHRGRIAGTAGYFEQLGFRPGRLFVITAALSEAASGILIALGLLGPIGPALLLSVMIVAAISVHWKNGVFATANGIEVPLLYATGAIALAFTGYGPFALDAALGIDHGWTSELKVAALAVGVVGGVVNLLARRSAAVAATA